MCLCGVSHKNPCGMRRASVLCYRYQWPHRTSGKGSIRDTRTYAARDTRTYAALLFVAFQTLFYL
jgi:hypothetical protein